MWKKLKGRILQSLIALLENEKPEIPRIPRFASDKHVLQVMTNGKDKYFYIGKRRLKEDEVIALRAEAKDFRGSFLWDLMRRDIHFLAYLQATAKRRADEDAIYAAAMYRDLEILETFIENCAEL